MTTREPSSWMWAEAVRMLDRAENLQRRFFEPGGSARQPCWEPPVDIFETISGLFIEIALPGVNPQQTEVIFEETELLIIGKRDLPLASEPAVIRRLEIPYGRFERRIPLPLGHYELARRETVAGCLLLSLRKLV
jgi:HSP20 family protein